MPVKKEKNDVQSFVENKGSIEEKIRDIISYLERISLGDFSKKISIPRKKNILTPLYKEINLMAKDLEQRKKEEKNHILHIEKKLKKEKEKTVYECENKYRDLFKNLMSGFAIHEIVLDKKGKPIDYVYEDINLAFEKIVNKKRKELIGKKATEIFPGIEKDPVNWIRIYGKVALTGKGTIFEAYSAVLKKWFSITVYSSEKKHFATLFRDITVQKSTEKRIQEKIQELESMNRLMVGRELKMIELKKEINTVKNKK